MRSGEASSADTRSYSDLLNEPTHEPRSRVVQRNVKSTEQDSLPRSSRRISSTPKTRLSELEEYINKSPALAPPSERSSRLQSSRQLASDSHDSTPESSQTSSSQSSEMPSRISINLPSPRLALTSKKKSRNSVVRAPAESHPEAQPPAQQMEPPTPVSPPRNPHRKGPPVRGRPLIFAAMAANPQAAEIEDEAAVVEEPPLETIPDSIAPQHQAISHNPPSQAYPSPRSSPVELSKSKSKSKSRKEVAQPEPEQPRRRRKLSKATKPIFRNDALPAQDASRVSTLR